MAARNDEASDLRGGVELDTAPRHAACPRRRRRPPLEAVRAAAASMAAGRPRR